MEVGVGPHGLVDAPQALGGRSLDAVGQRELDLRILLKLREDKKKEVGGSEWVIESRSSRGEKTADTTLPLIISIISEYDAVPSLPPLLYPLLQERLAVLITYVVLHGVCALGVFGGHDTRADDLDRAEPSTVATRHLRIELVDGARESQITILAVHVMRAGAGVVFEPDGVILDDAGVAFNQLVDVQNLARSLLHLVHLVQKVPEAGLGHYFVWCKDLHPKHRGVGVSLSGHVPSHHLVLTEPRLLGRRGREKGVLVRRKPCMCGHTEKDERG